jgi:L-2-hydroxyglutarate oxidase LhgO
VRVGVVGGGIVGLAVARALQARGDDVVVLEKEDRVGAHQTSRNSGVVHAGLYYAPGSLKATLCRRGGELLRALCAEHGIPYVACGKVVVARDAREVPLLDDIERRARANGVPGLARLDADGLRAVEPHAAGVAALHSPQTAITDFAAVARVLARLVDRDGGDVRLSAEVTAIAPRGRAVALQVGDDEHAVDRLVICAGLQSDRVARLAGDARAPQIIPFRGEYHRLVAGREDLVRGLIYPVPDPTAPFLGVHFTRRVDGGVDVGPNAVLALAREGYRRRDVRPRDVADALRGGALPRLARTHWRTALREARTSASRRAFVAAARAYVPELTARDVRPAPAGVRAQAVDPDGTLVDDFRISRIGRVVAVRNAPSPAATSALALAGHIAGELAAAP